MPGNYDVISLLELYFNAYTIISLLHYTTVATGDNLSSHSSVSRLIGDNRLVFHFLTLCDIIAGGEEDLLIESLSGCDIAGVLSLSIFVTVSAGVSLSRYLYTNAVLYYYKCVFLYAFLN